jgi:hypothetical protein
MLRGHDSKRLTGGAAQSRETQKLEQCDKTRWKKRLRKQGNGTEEAAEGAAYEPCSLGTQCTDLGPGRHKPLQLPVLVTAPKKTGFMSPGLGL